MNKFNLTGFLRTECAKIQSQVHKAARLISQEMLMVSHDRCRINSWSLYYINFVMKILTTRSDFFLH